MLIGLAQVTVLLLAGWIMGVPMPAGPSGVAVILAADVFVGSGIAILSLVLAFRLRSHGPFYSVIGFFQLPLTSLSTAFAPLATMAPWMRTLAAWNPPFLWRGRRPGCTSDACRFRLDAPLPGSTRAV